jgi:hypothetical protein
MIQISFVLHPPRTVSLQWKSKGKFGPSRRIQRKRDVGRFEQSQFV